MEEAVCCYICYEFETDTNQYLKEPSPCKCKGSIMIHKNCFEDIITKSRVCSICKTKYNMVYLPNRNGLELITEVAINGDITEYTIDLTGDIQGEHIVKKQSGEIISNSQYMNGLLHGKYQTWYLNGQLECECACLRNKIEGEYKSWYENGILMEQSFYVNGLKEGVSKYWDMNGNMKYTRVYVGGEVQFPN
jgi:antitoxin component YwqK of YwqJK toxin-antitoxin module